MLVRDSPKTNLRGLMAHEVDQSISVLSPEIQLQSQIVPKFGQRERSLKPPLGTKQITINIRSWVANCNQIISHTIISSQLFTSRLLLYFSFFAGSNGQKFRICCSLEAQFSSNDLVKNGTKDFENMEEAGSTHQNSSLNRPTHFYIIPLIIPHTISSFDKQITIIGRDLLLYFYCKNLTG